MSSEDLVKKLDAEEYILPIDISKNISDEELIKEMEEIFNKYEERLKKEAEFRRKYIDVLNYLIGSNLSKDKKIIIDPNIINTLLSYPEPA